MRILLCSLFWCLSRISSADETTKMHAAFVDNPNDFSDDYEQFQEIIFNHFKSKKERGDKIYIPQIMKLLSGEIECPNDDIVKEIEAERVSAMNDRDSLYSRLEILDEQLIKTEGQVALRDHELQNLRQDVLQLKEMVRGFESHQVLHELSVQQHCTELVTDLSRCREDLMNYLDQRNHLHELRSEKEDVMGLQECRRKLEAAEGKNFVQQVCPDRFSAGDESISTSHCSRAMLSDLSQRISSKLHLVSSLLWGFTVRIHEYLSPVFDEASSLYTSHLHPLYLAHLHPTLQLLKREFLLFLNTPLMVETLAYCDFFIRKAHIVLYRLHIEIPRYFDSSSRFASIITHRTIWNVDRFFEKLASSLSRIPGCNVLSSEEWLFSLYVGLFSLITMTLVIFRGRIYRCISWFLHVISFPLRYLSTLVFGKRTAPSRSPPPVSPDPHSPPITAPSS